MEVGAEPSDVVVEQCADTLRPGGRDNQTRVVRLYGSG